jgi:hypothetical protein
LKQAHSLDVLGILAQLARERKIFHSEADFQHALAWKIHELHPTAKLRLELPSGRFDKRERIDILVILDGIHCAIELKYKKRKLDGVFDGEKFVLSNDGAQDIGRYDFVKDVARLERYVGSTDNTVGWAVLLTNDDLYWRESPRGLNSAAFFLHEGRLVAGGQPLDWHARTGEGTKRGRAEPFTLRANYTLEWKHYSSVAGMPNGTFRYLALPVVRGPG